MKMTLEQVNTICMEMISNAGEGRALVYEALDAVTAKDYATAAAKLAEAEEHLAEAHRIQFEDLMAPQSNGVELPLSMLLLHAMDLTMVSTSEHDMLKSIVKAHLD